MSYLEDTPDDSCPFCFRALNEYINSESYAGKWVSVDVPVDILIGESVSAKDYLYRACKRFNETTEGKVRFNLDLLR